ncbi:MAG TPA: 5'-methylthioadenosine/adenosylhomocysteine nucleosidase [Burkholderiaceae bacterium]|nr:5'-methylthioadenosine/adenosylhomocysteine nucleosidase [Burkholderiaceae bacterium]
MTAPIRLGIISALQEEQAGLLETMRELSVVSRGMRKYALGKLGNLECVCVLSRIGKVAAATTAATLIERFHVTHIVFTGVAGAADPAIAIGDIVVAQALLQHDMNAAPLFPRFEIPLLGLSHFAADVALTNDLSGAAVAFLESDLPEVIPLDERDKFRLSNPRVHRGLIASGDEFVTNRTRLAQLKGELPELLAVEMEGAAVAQVCFEFGVPFAVIRTISDGANEDSPTDFMQFIDRIAARYAFGIVRRMCLTLSPQ